MNPDLEGWQCLADAVFALCDGVADTDDAVDDGLSGCKHQLEPGVTPEGLVGEILLRAAVGEFRLRGRAGNPFGAVVNIPPALLLSLQDGGAPGLLRAGALEIHTCEVAPSARYLTPAELAYRDGLKNDDGSPSKAPALFEISRYRVKSRQALASDLEERRAVATEFQERFGYPIDPKTVRKHFQFFIDDGWQVLGEAAACEA